jgi:hypothetical protein
MGVRRLLFFLLLLGVDKQALAIEEPAPLSMSPIDWLLPGLAYILPGIFVAIILNEYAPKIRLFWRMCFSVAFPMFFWIFVLYIIEPTDLSIFDLIVRIPELLLSQVGLIFFVPSCIVIAVVGTVDQRRRENSHGYREESEF